MSQVRPITQRVTRWGHWPKTAVAALVVGLVPAACGAEPPVQRADLSVQLVSAELPQRASTPTIASPYGAYLAGLVAKRDGDLESAADYMIQALRYDPDNPEVLLPALELAAATGRQDEAAGLAQRVIAVQPENPVANLVLTVEAARSGDMQRADEILAMQPERGINQILVPMLRAWVKTGEGDPDGGLERLSVLEGERGFAVLHGLHAALINEVGGRSETAATGYETLLSTTGRPTLRLTWLAGSFFERNGQQARALEVYRDFVSSNPGSDILAPMLENAEKGVTSPVEVTKATDGMAEVLFHIASLLSQESATDAALVHLYQAIALRPDFTLARVLLGEILQNQGRGFDAIAAYRSIPEDSLFGWVVRLRVAEELQALEEVDLALTELDDLAAERPGSYEPLFRKGNLLRAEERFEEAVVAYDDAVDRLSEILPRHWSLLYFRGIALERSDQWERAEADFLNALGLQPEQPYVMNYLAYSWVEKKKNLDEAEAMLVRAVKLRPRDGYIVDSLGWVYYRLGRYEEAVVQLEKAVELRPQDPVINDHLGDALWRVGRRIEARFQWNRSLSLDPEADQIPIIEKKIKDGMDALPQDI
ncbi:tetratricopeptide repeat protein [Pelagibius litoralis]|uniref:Tetratricopeptide repeat protein n=1 Tax=Pelagibius litoralis TaxID=374515 RepID=A0A967F235_9PROT|nr:tetratricopeptide repeat protein [Pelagibius litoralis]NIA71614.1 tetratricopeptide repeat protein [Pelagibius litoralis]